MGAVHMEHALRPGAFMQVVDILRHDQQLALPFAVEPRQRLMRGVRVLRLDGFAPHVVEAQDQLGIAFEGFGRGDILDPVLLPQSALGAEGVDPAFRADARAGENDDIAYVGSVGHAGVEAQASGEWQWRASASSAAEERWARP